MPDRFDLYLPHRDTTSKVHVQWRRGSQIGVAFDRLESAPTMPSAPQDLAARVQQLEAEVGLMRLLLSQMRSELGDAKNVRPAADVV